MLLFNPAKELSSTSRLMRRRFKQVINIMILLPSVSVSANASYNMGLEYNKSTTQYIQDADEKILINLNTSGVDDRLPQGQSAKVISESEHLVFLMDDQALDSITVPSPSDSGYQSGQQPIVMSFQPTEDMLGRRVVIHIEEENELSKLATASAILPSALIAGLTDPQYKLDSPWGTLLNLNYLLLDIKITDVVHNYLLHAISGDTPSLFAQCSADFAKGAATYALSDHGEAYDSNKVNSKKEHLKHNLRERPTDAFLNCMSNIVANSLLSAHKTGSIEQYFGSASRITRSLNPTVLRGVAKLMVGYSLNSFFSAIPIAFNDIKNLYKLNGKLDSNLLGTIKSALIASIQRTLNQGHAEIFDGLGMSSTNSAIMTSGVSALSVLYYVSRLYQIDDGNVKVAHFFYEKSIFARSREAVKQLNKTIFEGRLDLGSVAFGVISLSGGMYLLSNYVINKGHDQKLENIAEGVLEGSLYSLYGYLVLPKLEELTSYITQNIADRALQVTGSSSNWLKSIAQSKLAYRVHVTVLD